MITIVNRKADFFYKTIRFKSIRITNRIDSNRELECSTACWSLYSSTKHLYRTVAYIVCPTSSNDNCKSVPTFFCFRLVRIYVFAAMFSFVFLPFLRYDTRWYFNVRSKADASQLNLPHGVTTANCIACSSSANEAHDTEDRITSGLSVSRVA